MRAVVLSLLLLTGCITSRGRVNVPATAGVWGAAMIVGGATLAAGTCEPSDEQCDRVDRDPAAAAGFVIAGASLLTLAWLIHHSESD